MRGVLQDTPKFLRLGGCLPIVPQIAITFSKELENSHTHLNFPFEVGSSKRPQRSSVRKPVEVWKDEGCVDNSVVDHF